MTTDSLRMTVKREARAERMASAIEAALPLIRDMWEQFSYATDKDEEIKTELREAVEAFRRLQAEEREHILESRHAEDPNTKEKHAADR